MEQERTGRINYQHNWVKKELASLKYTPKVVTLKTDYKRKQNNLIKLKYEEFLESEEDDDDKEYLQWGSYEI